MRTLSKIKIKCNYAYCGNCKEFFIDDLPQYGSIYCPNPDCAWALYRGIKSIKKFKLKENIA